MGWISENPTRRTIVQLLSPSDGEGAWTRSGRGRKRWRGWGGRGAGLGPGRARLGPEGLGDRGLGRQRAGARDRGLGMGGLWDRGLGTGLGTEGLGQQRGQGQRGWGAEGPGTGLGGRATGRPSGGVLHDGRPPGPLESGPPLEGRQKWGAEGWPQSPALGLAGEAENKARRDPGTLAPSREPY